MGGGTVSGALHATETAASMLLEFLFSALCSHTYALVNTQLNAHGQFLADL